MHTDSFKACSHAFHSQNQVTFLFQDFLQLERELLEIWLIFLYVPLLLSLLCLVNAIPLQSAMKALILIILLSGDVERNPGPYYLCEYA